VNSEMHWEAVIEQAWMCNCRPGSSEFRDSLGDRDLIEFGVPVGGHDSASLEMQLETEIE
jgi:hypothetical protein